MILRARSKCRSSSRGSGGDRADVEPRCWALLGGRGGTTLLAGEERRVMGAFERDGISSAAANALGRTMGRSSEAVHYLGVFECTGGIRFQFELYKA